MTVPAQPPFRIAASIRSCPETAAAISVLIAGPRPGPPSRTSTSRPRSLRGTAATPPPPGPGPRPASRRAPQVHRLGCRPSGERSPPPSPQGRIGRRARQQPPNEDESSPRPLRLGAEVESRFPWVSSWLVPTVGNRHPTTLAGRLREEPLGLPGGRLVSERPRPLRRPQRLLLQLLHPLPVHSEQPSNLLQPQRPPHRYIQRAGLRGIRPGRELRGVLSARQVVPALHPGTRPLSHPTLVDDRQAGRAFSHTPGYHGLRRGGVL